MPVPCETDSEMQEYRGWLFPSDAEIPPEQHWYQIEFSGGTTIWDMNREGHLYLARQFGLEAIESEVAATGDSEGLLYASVTAALTLDGKRFEAVGGADESSQQVRDPEHVWSVAETRAIKRAVKRAVGVRDADTSTTDDHEEQVSRSGGVPSNAPESVDSPPSEWDGGDDTDDTDDGDSDDSGGESAEIADDGLDW